MTSRPELPPRPVELLLRDTWIPATAYAERHDHTGSWLLISYQHDRTTTFAWTLNTHIRHPREPRQT
ncbi:MAG TPA: hypothetical protein VFR22_10425 [Nocardioidaceae bacterium]|nr:hypothetical protein [Nocardioidaceae bacterium]